VATSVRYTDIVYWHCLAHPQTGCFYIRLPSTEKIIKFPLLIIKFYNTWYIDATPDAKIEFNQRNTKGTRFITTRGCHTAIDVHKLAFESQLWQRKAQQFACPSHQAVI